MTVLELGLKSLLGYLLGSVIGALVVGRLRGTADIRTVGSGNAGGTNALRTHGRGFAFWVMLIDIGKGVLAVTVLPALDVPGAGSGVLIARDWLTAACAVAVIVGHVYPVWYGFRGGKGAATFVGVLLGISPVLLLPVLGVWLLAVMLFGYVGLATILAGVSLPVYVSVAYSPAPMALFAFSLFFAGFVAFTHRSNIARMSAGQEPRVRKLWLFRR